MQTLESWWWSFEIKWNLDLQATNHVQNRAISIILHDVFIFSIPFSNQWWNSWKVWNKLFMKSFHPNDYTLNFVILTSINVTHSLISRNPRERMFVVQISLLIVTFLSLISWNLSLMQTTKEVNPHPCLAPCANMWNVTFFFFCHVLNVGACVRHISWEGQVEWTTLL